VHVGLADEEEEDVVDPVFGEGAFEGVEFVLDVREVLVEFFRAA